MDQNTAGFYWPRSLVTLLRAADNGELERRPLFPVEVGALSHLVSGAGIGETPVAVAPGMTIARRIEESSKNTFPEYRGIFLVEKHMARGTLRALLVTKWIGRFSLKHGCERALALRPAAVESTEVWFEPRVK